MASVASKNEFITDLDAGILFIYRIPDSYIIYPFFRIIKGLIQY